MICRNLLLLGLSSLVLQGCIAAAAIPIVAGGGALVRNGVSDDARSGGAAIRTASAPVASPAADPTPTPTPALATAEPAAAPEPASGPTLAKADPAQAPTGAADPAARRIAGSSAAQAALNMPLGEGYDALHSYALRTLGEGMPMTSAMLADPTSLQPVRSECGDNPPTVVIDIDPEDGLVPLVGPLDVNAELSSVLDDLRARDVTIAWMTDRGPVDARAVRDRLVAAGLDRRGTDSLYVERYPGETKQERRAALAETRCVIALAGDTRADFDVLFDYLINPADARPLDALLNNGWFLIGNPIGG